MRVASVVKNSAFAILLVLLIAVSIPTTYVNMGKNAQADTIYTINPTIFTHLTKLFTNLPQTYTIDWALSSPSMSPPSPNVGDLVTFNGVVTQISSDWPGPLSVSVSVKLDGNAFDFKWVYQNQAIPPGITQTVSSKPWTATAGTHLVTWTLMFFGGDETVILKDPFPNNEASLQVVVGSAFDFTLALSPPSLTVKQGETARYQILISYSDPSYSGTSITVQVMGLGPGMNYQLTPIPPSVSISTSQTTPPSSYNIILRGSAMGVVHEAYGTLTVTPEQTASSATTTSATSISTTPFNYSISISPSTRTVEDGKTASYIVTATPISGSAPVSLGLEGVPGDIQWSFSTQTGTPPFSSTLTLDLSTSSAVGTYTLTVVGKGAGNIKTATATLTAKAKVESTSTPLSATSSSMMTVETEGNGSDLSILFSNAWPLMAIILIIVIIALAIALMKRRPPAYQKPQTSVGYCSNCGAQLSPGIAFCSSCGQRIEK